MLGENAKGWGNLEKKTNTKQQHISNYLRINKL